MSQALAEAMRRWEAGRAQDRPAPVAPAQAPEPEPEPEPEVEVVPERPAPVPLNVPAEGQHVVQGDCIELMRGLPDASVDAIVTDPPYGLEFMGKAWDKLDRGADVRQPFRGEVQTPDNPYGRTPVRYGYGNKAESMQEWHRAWAVEALRVLKPGGHLLAFGGTRTYHRLACAIEDAGFEIRDTLAWLYGTGFPKSLDVSKAVDKRRDDTEAARRWQGWGTALKPAHEPIVVARKPIAGTVAANVLEHGTGALNVDGCRIESGGTHGSAASAGQGSGEPASGVPFVGGIVSPPHPEGRWPANVVLDEESARLLDEQTGTMKDGVAVGGLHSAPGKNAIYARMEKVEGAGDHGYGGSGGASRFFYVAKASRAERNAGLEGFEASVGTRTPMAGRGQGGLKCRTCGRWKVSGNPCTCVEPDFEPSSFERPATANHHPTVKPIALMRWLVRLVTPPGGLVLDPFVGSGTTGCAAALEGLRFLGMEREAEYIDLARARIAHWAEQDE